MTYGCIVERSVEPSLNRGEFVETAKRLLVGMAALVVALGSVLVLVLATGHGLRARREKGWIVRSG